MAWRIDEHIIRGEIDSRERGRVSGRLWFHGRENPVVLNLEGGPGRDLAGHVLRFTNPEPKAGDLSGLTEMQEGVVGDITASRKVKVPECSMEELLESYKAKRKFPWHWANSLYLEWFSRTNGRVVIKSASYVLEIEPAAAWEMTEAEEAAQHEANAAAMMSFMDDLGKLISGETTEETDDDDPRSDAEREAETEDARMNLLLDRVTARLDREGHAESDFSRILEEERERLNLENGVKPEKLTDKQQAEREAWREEMIASANEAMQDMEAEKWKDDGGEEPAHPLVERATELSIRLHHEVDAAGWVPDGAPDEHPLYEIVGKSMSAAAKLAGALGMCDDDEPWPPDALIAGDVIVRLKNARNYIADCLRALDSADTENLADAPWRAVVRCEFEEISAAVTNLIREAREVPGDAE